MKNTYFIALCLIFLYSCSSIKQSALSENSEFGKCRELPDCDLMGIHTHVVILD